MTIEEYKNKVRAEIHRLNPNLSEDDWKEIEADLTLTIQHQSKDGKTIVADPKDEAYLLLL